MDWLNYLFLNLWSSTKVWLHIQIRGGAMRWVVFCFWFSISMRTHLKKDQTRIRHQWESISHWSISQASSFFTSFRHISGKFSSPKKHIPSHDNVKVDSKVILWFVIEMIRLMNINEPFNWSQTQLFQFFILLII